MSRPGFGAMPLLLQRVSHWHAQDLAHPGARGRSVRVSFADGPAPSEPPANEKDVEDDDDESDEVRPEEMDIPPPGAKDRWGGPAMQQPDDREGPFIEGGLTGAAPALLAVACSNLRVQSLPVAPEFHRRRCPGRPGHAAADLRGRRYAAFL
uniref:Uncharacterized protein n=1 Tax=Alexandrium monilatum TaxID=311494 RepID=A0A7S4PSG4_9DINO|mmetsp:Transcript_63008/g.197309  ORF Transcript_63008/g.197309 Transcript_63008/m.197309 type:complete len:152 (+) Transcript_63008:52-507(+)